MHPLDDLKEWLEEAGETLGGIRDHIVGEITEFLEDFKEPFFDEPADALEGVSEYRKRQAAGFDRNWKYFRASGAFGKLVDFGIELATYRAPKGAELPGGLEHPTLLSLLRKHWTEEYKREFEPVPVEVTYPPMSETNLNRVQGVLITTPMLKEAADQRERRNYLLPKDWDLEILPNQRLADLQELGFVSGDVTAQTWLLGDTLEHDLAPALSGAGDSITPADIAFGEMDMGYDDLRWVSDATLEGLTVNAAAMSGAVTPWAAGISKEVEQRRREIEAFRPQPAPVARRDSPPGGGSSGGGLSWDEGVDLYQRRSGETAENIEWMRERPDDIAESGPNAGIDVPRYRAGCG